MYLTSACVVKIKYVHVICYNQNFMSKSNLAESFSDVFFADVYFQ